jgi:parallel beta-helix repeat protein
MYKKILLCVGITILFLGTCFTSSVAIDIIINPILFGNTLYVGGSGLGNYTKIQDAIDDANDWDTVFVYNGIYHENIDIEKSIKLIGENRNTTVIDGDNIDDVVIITADFVNLCDFTIINSGKNNYDAGLEICSNHNIIFNNSFHDNKGESFVSGGILINSSSHNNIYFNEMYDNNYDGITLMNSDNNHIHLNTIYNNKRLGITLTNSSDNIIEDNYVYENFCGICLYPYSIRNTVKNNNIYNHPCCGIALKKFSNYNLIQSNLVIDNLGQGITLGPGPTSRNIVELNTISGCTISPWRLGAAIILDHAFLNTIKKNNIIDNLRDVSLNSSFATLWLNNYWDNYLGFGPKVIVGWVYLPLKLHMIIPWLNFDWNPASKPHVI